MWILGKSLKKKYQLKEDVRESLYDDVNFWMKSLRAKGTPFMGGEQPGNILLDFAILEISANTDSIRQAKERSCP